MSDTTGIRLKMPRRHTVESRMVRVVDLLRLFSRPKPRQALPRWYGEEACGGARWSWSRFCLRLRRFHMSLNTYLFIINFIKLIAHCHGFFFLLGVHGRGRLALPPGELPNSGLVFLPGVRPLNSSAGELVFLLGVANVSLPLFLSQRTNRTNHGPRVEGAGMTRDTPPGPPG